MSGKILEKFNSYGDILLEKFIEEQETFSKIEIKHTCSRVQWCVFSVLGLRAGIVSIRLLCSLETLLHLSTP